MEAALNTFNINSYGKEKSRLNLCKVAACDLLNCSSARILKPLSDIDCVNRFKERGEFTWVTGSGVLLRLPPVEGVTDGRSQNDALRNDTEKTNVSKKRTNVFINICPVNSNGTSKQEAEERSSEMGTGFLVTLTCTQDEDSKSRELNNITSLSKCHDVTVVDLSVDSRLLQGIKSQNDVNSFNNSVIEYVKSSSMQNFTFGDSAKKNFSYSIVYKVLSKENDPAADAEYQSDSPKISSKNRKSGKKNKRESTISGNEKKSKFTCDKEDIHSQVNILRYRKYRACNLKTYTNCIREQLLQKSINNGDQQEEANNREQLVFIKIDLEGIKLSSGFEIDIINQHVILRCNSGIFNTVIKIKVPETLVFKDKRFASYFEKEGIINIFIEVQNVQPDALVEKKLLHQSFSEDSGIEYDDQLQCIFDIQEQSELDALTAVSDSSAENSIQKQLCDINECSATSKAKVDLKGSIPIYLIEQSLHKILLTLSGLNVLQETLQIVQHSDHLVSVFYIVQATNSIPQKVCLYVSSINLSQEDNIEEYPSFKIRRSLSDSCNINVENAIYLKNARLSSGKLFIELDKSRKSSWASVWVGQPSLWEEVILVGSTNVQVPEPLQLTESLSTCQAENGGDDDEEKEEKGTGGVKEDVDNTEDTRVMRDEDESDGEVSSEEHSGEEIGIPKSEKRALKNSAQNIGLKNSSAVNVNNKKKLGDVSNKADNNLRTKNGQDRDSTSSRNSSGVDNFSSENNNSKNNTKAVKDYIVSPIEDKENNCDVCEDDNVFTSSSSYNNGVCDGATDDGSPGKGTVPAAAVVELQNEHSDDWSQQGGKRLRRSSEGFGVSDRKPSAKDRLSPPLSASGRPRSILKRRGRSLSESHIDSVEECLGEELLGKYDSVERALVGEYGCLEGLLEECGELEDDTDGGANGSAGSKKSVTFNDVEKTHLFMSKTSIVNQLANDDKKAMRMKMKEHKKKAKLDKRQSHKNGSTNFNSSYRNNSGYNSFDDELTTEESDGAELCSSSSGGETSDTNTDNEEIDSTKETPKIMEPSKIVVGNRNKKQSGKKRGKKSKNKRIELTNNMIFQLDMES